MAHTDPIMNIQSAFDGSVWFTTEDKLGEIQAFVEGIDPNRERSPEARADYIAYMEERREMTQYERAGIEINEDGVAHVKIHGTIMKRAGMMMRFSGGVSADELREGAVAMASDDSVKRVVLDINSPGGSVEGVEEARQALIALRDVKPVYAVSNDMAASAGFYLGSACTEFYTSPSGVVGSIGVYSVRMDRSKQLKDRGVKYEVIKRGEYKALGADGEPMAQKERKERQRLIDHYYDMFVAAVAENLSISHDEALALADGRVFVGSQAVTIGMASAVKSLTDVLASAGADAKAETKLDTLSTAYSAAQETIASLETERNDLKAEIEQRDTAKAEAQADTFLATLQEEGKIRADATEKQIASVRASLISDFDGAKAQWDLVPAVAKEEAPAPKAAAAPITPTPITAVASTKEDLPDEIDGKPVQIAMTAAQAKVYQDHGIPFRMADA